MADRTIGPYRIIEEIDSGGMAHVFRAEDTQGRYGIVALKVMRDEIAMGEEYQIRFRREARIWANLDHPNIVSVVDFSIDPEQAYVAMRYINGCSLHCLLADRPTLPVDYALPIMKDILRAVAYAHEQKVIHRDIKPDNVLLDRNRKAYLTDFGIAKPMEATELTHTGARLGTPTYMSPEQIRGKKDITSKADLYSIGVLFYEMLTGKPPFDKDDPIALGHAHAYETPPPMKRRGHPLPEELKTLVLKALKKQPRRRPRSAMAMLRALERFEKRRAEERPARRTKRKPKADEAVASARRRRAEQQQPRTTSLVVGESGLGTAPSPPLAAFLRIALLLFAAALLLGFGVPTRFIDSAAGVLKTIRDSCQRLFQGRASVEGVRLLETGNPRLAILSFQRSLDERPGTASEVARICLAAARHEARYERLRHAELLAAYSSKLEPNWTAARFFLARILLRRNRSLCAAREYIRALGWVNNHNLLHHFEEYGDVASSLPGRERNLAASRYYLAARGLVASGNADLASPYLRVARALAPSNLVYKRLLKKSEAALSRH